MPPPIAQALAVLRADPILCPVIDSITLSPLVTTTDLFASLCHSIVSQQISIQAAATIVERLNNLYGDCQLFPETVLTTDDEMLRRIGLSGQKTRYIKAAARYWLDNDLSNTDWTSLSDADIVTMLTGIKGVGVWTVQMLLIFDLDRPDVFPVLDFGIRDAMTRLYKPETTDPKKLSVQLHTIAAHWQPHRSLACRYLWQWRDSLLRSKDKQTQS